MTMRPGARAKSRARQTWIYSEAHIQPQGLPTSPTEDPFFVLHGMVWIHSLSLPIPVVELYWSLSNVLLKTLR